MEKNVNILHYALGFPPYRTGGLTRYCMDLMKVQIRYQHQVGLLWPGTIKRPGGRVAIRKRMNHGAIDSYEIINPLPVPLDEGIQNIAAYCKKGSMEAYLEYLRKYQFDVIHIHTLMGLHKEFVLAAQSLGIKLIFTSHDYFGICPKVTLYQEKDVCMNDHQCTDCIQCNQAALSIRKIVLLQSNIYRKLKDTVLISMLRAKHRNNFFIREDHLEVQKKTMKTAKIQEQGEAYQRLRTYYMSMLECMDVVHFNSNLARMVYLRYMTPKREEVISITNRNISNQKEEKEYTRSKLRISYLAPPKPYKGFELLIGVLDELYSEGEQNFKLRLFQYQGETKPYMQASKNRYHESELPQIMKETDMLVVPSIWYETFGFTALEAISYGVPVLVSSRVGAKDLLSEYMPENILEPDPIIWKNAIRERIHNRQILRMQNELIVESFPVKMLNYHYCEVMKLYEGENKA